MILLDISPHIQMNELDSTCNDSDPKLCYVSFDDHNESNPVHDEPIETHPFQAEFFEPLKVSP